MQDRRRAKILCTLGPASVDPEVIGALIDAGADAFRINFSHGTFDDHAETYRRVRERAAARGRAVTILADLQGPKIRVGKLPDDGIPLAAGDRLVLTCDPKAHLVDGRVLIDYPPLAREAAPGQPVLFDDGGIEAEIAALEGDDLVLKILNRGILHSRKGVNLPKTRLSLPSLTDKDVADLRACLQLGVDMVALSFVRTAEDLQVARGIMRETGRVVPLIAKVEKPEAVANLEAIVEQAEGLMVARGDLGVEMGPEEVPIVQKRLIALANRRGKLVITATQMLDSMIRNPRPTRAEASDVANAVLDGTDALMLSGETAVGRYPTAAVETMARIIVRTERAAPPDRDLPDKDFGHGPNAVARAAVTCARSLHDTAAIVVYTGSGGSARLISDYRPPVPIVAFTPEPDTYQQLGLYWGVYPQLFTPSSSHGGDSIFVDLERALLERALLPRGARVVIVMGYPLRARMSANLLKLHTLGDG